MEWVLWCLLAARIPVAHGLRDRTKDRKVSAALAIREASVRVRSEQKGDQHAWICREARSTRRGWPKEEMMKVVVVVVVMMMIILIIGIIFNFLLLLLLPYL